ncbi:hypothetical protein ISN44_As12g002890 [Arabidopsis suecica]|uniref:Uncharacterized protein n=1 Tax=Arabidopsis suecica TaxID=45249 RepID=A0A8T1YFB0_ARASU|nr:hypothetical protein ISN44_As12g002890 [Arabidopsis suecica]
MRFGYLQNLIMLCTVTVVYLHSAFKMVLLFAHLLPNQALLDQKQQMKWPFVMKIDFSLSLIDGAKYTEIELKAIYPDAKLLVDNTEVEIEMRLKYLCCSSPRSQAIECQ